MKKFFVLHEAKNGYATWDTFSGEFKTQEAAINAADDEWRYLTESEQRKRIVTACSVNCEPDEDIWDAINREGYEVLAVFE